MHSSSTTRTRYAHRSPLSALRSNPLRGPRRGALLGFLILIASAQLAVAGEYVFDHTFTRAGDTRGTEWWRIKMWNTSTSPATAVHSKRYDATYDPATNLTTYTINNHVWQPPGGVKYVSAVAWTQLHNVTTPPNPHWYNYGMYEPLWSF
ncbi:MAG: hypothetical protein R3B90_20020 [Planctomycetaceae bacterium]